MASKEVEDEEREDVDTVNAINGSDVISKPSCNVQEFTLQAEEYLNSDDVKFCTDAKLRREKQKLEDLLKSYKKLINKLDSKFQTKEKKIAEEKRLAKVPEIYAVLHPELYKNPREEEKTRLIQKFSKRQFSPADRIVPPICRTPLINVSDKRQEEKERFIKILSSCPARLVNTSDNPIPIKKIRRPPRASLSPCANERESEKERLAKIFATSGIYYRKHLDPRSISLSQRRDKENMVRVGEYSPLSSKERHLTHHGFSLPEEKPAFQPALDRKLTTSTMSKPNEIKVDRCISTNDLEEIDQNDGGSECYNKHSPEKRNSISTQTDPSDISNECNDETIQSTLSPRGGCDQQQVYYLSPREKLMSDLHGVSQCFPGVSSKVSPREDSQDVKLRQAAYAKALQLQIEEKKMMEEERKRREKAEEELIQQRILNHQKKLEVELSEEQKKKEDWLAQRQSHEEVLRRKMIEMKIEAQELKKSERRKRRDSELSETRKDNIYSKPLPTIISESCLQSRLTTPKHQQKSIPSKFKDFNDPTDFKESERSIGNSDSLLHRAPLLDADRQNMLSAYQCSPLALPTTNISPQKKGDIYGEHHKILDKQRAENLLKTRLDFRIKRPSSPPIPAVQTRSLLKNHNTKLLDDKWKVPKEGKELHRTQIGSGRDNILSQLGAFRRQLHQEHVKLEARLQKQQTP